MIRLRSLAWPCLVAATTWGGSPYREPVSFSIVSNAPVGRSVYVVGSHPDVGSWDPARAVRLANVSGSTWSGSVGIQAGTALEYKFISRSNVSNVYCDSANVHWQSGANLTTNVPAQPDAPYAGKTIYYHTSWTNVTVIYTSGSDTNFYGAPMTRLGQGRTPAESLHRVQGIGQAGEAIQFVMTDGQGNYDHAPYSGYGNPGPDYYTTLDQFFLQDGHVFNYWPPAVVGGSRIVTTFVGSSYSPTIPGRNIRIYLPRGYDTNTWKRYPVLYLHDGQNVFKPGGTFGCWFAEDAADKEISQGRMRETIIVGIDNTANRIPEYLPPGDSYSGDQGIGDVYMRFVVNNVRPTLDFNYRTMNDLANTLTLGSSMGGVISTYMGLETNVFGKIGPMSPAYWICPNFRTRIANGGTLGLRVYHDWGSSEGASMWDYCWPVRAEFVKDGYAENKDHLTVVGCGAAHNEAAWAARLPGAYRFLLNVWDEPSQLAHRAFTPAIEGFQYTGGTARISHAALAGQPYIIERSDAGVAGPWLPVATGTVQTLPWSDQSTAVGALPGTPTSVAYRIRATAR